MLFQNNKAIDTTILSDRIRMELTLLHCPGHEHAESKVVPNALLPKAGAGSSLGTANPRRTQMGIADRIKSIPIVGEMAAWAAWIFRVRQIARIASRTEANLAKIHNQVARIDNQVARIDNQVARIDARLTGIDGRVGALEPLPRSFHGRTDSGYQPRSDVSAASLVALVRNNGQEACANPRDGDCIVGSAT